MQNGHVLIKDEAIRLEALEKSMEHGSLSRTADEVVSDAAKFETYLRNGVKDD